MPILETADDLVFLLADQSLMSLDIARETEIVRRAERGDGREGDLTRDLRETCYESIECVIDTVMVYLFLILSLSFYEYRRHRLHEIVDEYPQSSRGRESSCGVIRLKEESHLLKGEHIIADGSRRYLEVILREKRLRSRDLTCLYVLFDDELEDVHFAPVDLMHGYTLETRNFP